MIHDSIVSALWPGDEPIAPGEYRNPDLLGSAVGRPFQTAFGRELHEGVVEKGAALFHSLIANHPFYNGNKRTAVLALDAFLVANGLFLVLLNADMYKLAKETATYRERGVSHQQAFQRIVDTLQGSVLPLSQLKKTPGMGALYRAALETKRLVRNNPLNRHHT